MWCGLQSGKKVTEQADEVLFGMGTPIVLKTRQYIGR